MKKYLGLVMVAILYTGVGLAQSPTDNLGETPPQPKNRLYLTTLFGDAVSITKVRDPNGFFATGPDVEIDNFAFQIGFELSTGKRYHSLHFNYSDNYPDVRTFDLQGDFGWNVRMGWYSLYGVNYVHFWQLKYSDIPLVKIGTGFRVAFADHLIRSSSSGANLAEFLVARNVGPINFTTTRYSRFHMAQSFDVRKDVNLGRGLSFVLQISYFQGLNKIFQIESIGSEMLEPLKVFSRGSNGEFSVGIRFGFMEMYHKERLGEN